MFSVVYHQARISLNISLTEYIIIDTINFFSKNGLCRVSTRDIADKLGVAKSTVADTIQKYSTCNRPLLAKSDGGLKTTEAWKTEIESAKLLLKSSSDVTHVSGLPTNTRPDSVQSENLSVVKPDKAGSLSGQSGSQTGQSGSLSGQPSINNLNNPQSNPKEGGVGEFLDQSGWTEMIVDESSKYTPEKKAEINRQLKEFQPSVHPYLRTYRISNITGMPEIEFRDKRWFNSVVFPQLNTEKSDVFWLTDDMYQFMLGICHESATIDNAIKRCTAYIQSKRAKYNSGAIKPLIDTKPPVENNTAWKRR